MVQHINEQQRAFIFAYLRHGNAARAAREAGYGANPARPEQASDAAWELLHNPIILAEIERLYMLEGMRAMETIYRLSAIARADVTEFMSENEDGEYVVDHEKIVASDRSFVIKSYERNLHGVKLTLHDSLVALDKLGRFHDLFASRLDLEQWQLRAINDIRRGLLRFEPLVEEVGAELAQQLFKEAGVSIPLMLPEETPKDTK